MQVEENRMNEQQNRSKKAGSGFLRNARVYLSGPMDFVHCRKTEKETGWRVRIGQFLQSLGVTVFDPWAKPQVLGMYEYGREGEKTTHIREEWTFESTEDGRKRRRRCSDVFRETMHIDLRMVDVSDFIIAYCPTNIYSVGTPHEVIVACEQHKPVLFISPPVTFPALDQLQQHLDSKNDTRGRQLLEQLIKEAPIKSNPQGIPSLWYMPLVGSENFFDGFGFEQYRDAFGWGIGPTDIAERQRPPQRPLLKFLEELDRDYKIPQKWDPVKQKMCPDDDWLLLDLKNQHI